MDIQKLDGILRLHCVDDVIMCRKQILSLLGENEVVVLDAPEVEHVGLLDVRGSDASGVKETAIEQTSGAAFREMIEDGNWCQCTKVHFEANNGVVTCGNYGKYIS